MTTDPFADAARAEAERRYIENDPDHPDRVTAIARTAAFAVGAEWARTHRAAQEPTDAECIAFWYAFEDAADETNIENIRAALSAARAARRDEEDKQ